MLIVSHKVRFFFGKASAQRRWQKARVSHSSVDKNTALYFNILNIEVIVCCILGVHPSHQCSPNAGHKKLRFEYNASRKRNGTFLYDKRRSNFLRRLQLK